MFLFSITLQNLIQNFFDQRCRIQKKNLKEKNAIKSTFSDNEMFVKTIYFHINSYKIM